MSVEQRGPRGAEAVFGSIGGRDGFWHNGRFVPVFAGGDGNDPPADPAPTDPPADPDPDDLGEAGKKALAAERDRAKQAEKARKAAEKEAVDLKERLEKIEAGNKSEQEKELEKARKEAGDTARAEERAASNTRIIKAEVKAAAGAKFADPNDAVVHLDLEEFEVDDDGNVDQKAITKALDDLLEQKPYLKNGVTPKDPKKPAGSPDGGPKKTTPGDEKGDEIVGRRRIQSAYASKAKE